MTCGVIRSVAVSQYPGNVVKFNAINVTRLETSISSCETKKEPLETDKGLEQ